MSGQLADYRDVMDRLASSLEDVAGSTASAEAIEAAEQTAADARTKASKALDAAMASRLDLGAFDMTFKSVIASALGVRVYDMAAPKAKKGDRVYIHPTASWPEGYAVLGAGYVNADRHVEVRLLTPVVSIAADVKLPCQLIGFRPVV